MRRIALFAICLTWWQACASSPVTLLSPDGGAKSTLEAQNGRLVLTLERGGKPLLLPSVLNPEIEGRMAEFTTGKARINTVKNTYSLRMGEWSSITDCYTEATVDVESLQAAGTLHIRLYDNTLAYRFVLSPKPTVSSLRDCGSFVLPEETQLFAPNDERGHFGPMTPADMAGRRYKTPFLCRLPQGYAMIHEADLRTMGQMLLAASDDGKSIAVDIDAVPFDGRVELPWRVVAFSDDIAGLYAAKKNFWGMAPPAESDFEWVKPGIALWDWRVTGAGYGSFTYRYDTESYMRLIDHASRMGIPYLLLDASWCRADEGLPLTPANGVDMAKITAHARSKGIGLWLYYDLQYTDRAPQIDFDTVARTLAKMGAVGVKYGFLGIRGPKFDGLEKVRQTCDKIATAAKYRLMIDFHDSPVPFSGIERTWPNYMTREYCHAQMDSRAAFSPGDFVRTAFINLWAGGIDQSNGVYAPEKVMERDKGPKNPLYTTIAAENARFLITHTGRFATLPDAPEEYEAHADMFAFIRQMPAVWNDTQVVDGDFPRFITMARRSGGRWFVGTVFAEEGGSHTLNLTFLDAGKTYRATIFADAPDAHYMTARGKYRIERRNVTVADAITVNVACGGGYSVLFEP